MNKNNVVNFNERKKDLKHVNVYSANLVRKIKSAQDVMNEKERQAQIKEIYEELRFDMDIIDDTLDEMAKIKGIFKHVNTIGTHFDVMKKNISNLLEVIK